MRNTKKRIVSFLSAVVMVFTVLPSTAMQTLMASAATEKVIWQGTATSTGWSSVELTGNVDLPNEAEEGGVLTIYATGSSKVQIGAIQPEDQWTQLDSGDGNDAFNINNGKVVITLSEKNANLLKNAIKLHVNGDGITVTKLTYKAPESMNLLPVPSTDSYVVWEGAASAYNWSSVELTGDIILPTNAETNGVLTVEGSGSEVQIAPIQPGNEWQKLMNGSSDVFNLSSGKVNIKLNASNANLLKNCEALHINGNNVTVTKVIYTKPGSVSSSSNNNNFTSAPDSDSYVVWQGSLSPTGWASLELTGNITLPTNAQVGGYLVVDATGSSQVQIGTIQPDESWHTVDTPTNGNAYNIVSGKASIPITSNNVNYVKNAVALHINGDGITATKITYYAPGTYNPPESSSNNNYWSSNNYNSSENSYGPLPEPEGDVETSELGEEDFNSGKGLPWHICESMTGKLKFEISGGTYNIEIVNPGGASNGGEDRWDCQFRHRGITIEAGHRYRITYSVKSTKAGHMYAKLGSVVNPETVEFWHGDGKVLNMPTLGTDATREEIEAALLSSKPTGTSIDYGMGYENWKTDLIPANKWVTYAYEFVPTQTEIGTCEYTFHFGGDGIYTDFTCFPAGTKLQFDNMSLIDLTDSKSNYPIEKAYERNGILVNQLGYIAGLSKKATLLVSEGDMTPKTFYVVDAESGEKVYHGKSTPIGADKDSGDFIHTIDFTGFNTVKVVNGNGNNNTGAYYLTCDGKKSYKFNLGSVSSTGSNRVYSGLLKDSLNFFYQQRSGIDIESQYITSGDKSALARSAGHLPDKAYIQNDWIPSYLGDGSDIQKQYGTLDTTGGWYDAGDHGKYVVNSGVSVWTLSNMYEREKELNHNEAKFADGTMSIPENDNGYPDLLDEVRYNVEFMLKMQRTDGMVYHKIHDYKWSALAVPPADDPYERIVKPVSTCATLNLAATAAQSARLWKGIDDNFATKCLNAAKKAYTAAKQNPEMYAPTDQSIGGGPYGDTYAEDDFYWAACELYISTGDSTYYTDLKKYKNENEGASPADKAFSVTSMLASGENEGSHTAFTWGSTAALGTLSLALHQDKLTTTEANTVVNSIKKAADDFIALENSQGNGIPYGSTTFYDTFNCPDEEFYGYEWGSNSMVVNNAIIMAYAADFGGENANKYANGVVTAMDYIFGRNPLEYSYVTGYGDHTTQYVHHRYWSGQLDSSLPYAPNGVLSGGPNSAMQDPWIKGAGYKVGAYPPQCCYLDHIESWSTNECTINWNSPLAWTTNFLEDYDAGEYNNDDPGPDDSSDIIDGDYELEYVSTNLTLSGIIGANTYFTVPATYVNNNFKVEAVFTASGVDTIRVSLDKSKTKTINDVKTYIFTLPVKSCDMAKRFNGKVVVTDLNTGEQVDVSNTVSITLNQYISSLANTGTSDQKTFAKAMQTYGYYAQKTFLGTTPSGITPIDLSDVTYSKLRSYQSSTKSYSGTVKGTIFGTSLYLDSGTAIRSYIKDLNGVNTNNLYMQYTANGETKRVKAQYSAENDAYYGEISDIGANKLATMYDICFTEGTTQISDTSVYGAYSYIYSTLRNTGASANLQNLAKALYKYSLASMTIDNPSYDESSSAAESSSKINSSSNTDSSSKTSSSSNTTSSSSSKASSSSSSNTTSDDIVIWTGSETINKWQSVELEGIGNIPEAKENGILTIYATPIDSTKTAQVQIGTIQGENLEWVTLEDKAGNDAFDIFGGKAQIKLSAENAQLLKETFALHLNGTNVNVTKVIYNDKIDPNQVIWEGNDTITSWTYDLSLGVANLPLAEAGGKIIVEATSIGDAPQIQISGNDINWDWFDVKDPSTGEAFDLTDSSVTIVLDAESADTIANAKKLYLKGCDVKVIKVTYVAPNGNTPTPSSSSTASSSSKTDSSSSSASTAEVIWTGSEEINSWTTDVEFYDTSIPAAKSGSVIRIDCTAIGSNPQVQLSGSDENYDWFDVTDPSTGYAFNVYGSYVDITLDSKTASIIKTADRLVLKGIGVKVTKVTFFENGVGGGDVNTTEAVTFAKNLKLGWNLGNSLDADGNSQLNSELSWGNPTVTKSLIDYVKSVGFTTIRIPVSWGNHADSDYNIDSRWMNRVTEVVDYAWDNGFYVIINTHHDCEYYYPTEDNYSNASNFIKTIWRQVADNFENYDEKLIYESMNEPRLMNTNKEWWFGANDSEGIASIKTIVKLNQDFVNTVRSRSGYNKTRFLMVPSNAASPDNALNSNFTMPTDTVSGKLMVSIHAYRPDSFAMSGSGDTNWDSSMVSQLGFMDQIYSKFVTQGYGVVIGEFGATNKDNESARAAWANDYTKKAASLGFAAIYWDNNMVQVGSENFGLVNRKTLSLYYPSILSAMLNNYK